jgi:EAL domain-containing protein (putative c-di-GMP-specific phosphodiesterase class I)
VPPGEFIPIAESSGLIGALTRRVLQKACRAAASWPSDVRIAVNISAQSFRSGDLSDAVMSALLGSGLSPSRLEIEVTESLFLEQDTQIDLLLGRLRSAGVRMVLDDFGTGYSSLSYLRSFRFDTIKIDQSFVRSAGEVREDKAVIEAIAFLAQQLDMETVAEGIETPRQLAFVRAIISAVRSAARISAGRSPPVSMWRARSRAGSRRRPAKVRAQPEVSSCGRIRPPGSVPRPPSVPHSLSHRRK